MANIKDLAQLAGVSVTAVSQVLNNHPYVSKGNGQQYKEVRVNLNN